MYFDYLVINSPWKRTWPFNWINLNPLHPRMLVPNTGSGEKDFKNFVNVLLLFRNYIPLEKGTTLQARMIWAKFGWNWPSGSGEEDENVNIWTNKWTDGRQTTDDRRLEKITWALSSGELKILGVSAIHKWIQNLYKKLKRSCKNMTICTFSGTCTSTCWDRWIWRFTRLIKFLSKDDTWRKYKRWCF